MAKAKKKESTLTLEEKLAQALVPESEQPYKVPKNWCWVKGLNLFEPMQSKKPEGKYFIYIDIESVDNKRQCIESPKNILVSKAPSRASRELKFGDTVFSMVRPYLRNIAFIDESLSDAIASTGFYVCRPNKAVFNKYNYWMLVSDYVVEGLNRFMKGDNSPSIRRDDIEQFAYPLPPFSEQQRIVERIEGLFAKLDEAKQKLQEVLDGFETRKAAILHKAFTGELTAKWREENGVSLESWRYLAFKDIADIKSNLVEPSMYLELPHIAPDNIEKNTGKLLEYRTVFEDDLKSAKHHFFAGQILYSKIRPNLSKVVMVDFEGLCSADMYPIEAYEDSKYLWYYMLSNNFLVQACNAGSRSVLPKINQKELSKIEVVVPTILEQRHIVSILNEHMRKEDMLKIKAEEALEKIDGIKKAILVRAFRGELGTNDDNDECAVELLKRVL